MATMAKEQKDIQIAIIGTPAAGKTVFASVWATRMTNRGDQNSLSKRRGWVSLNSSDTALEVKDENNNVKSWTTFKYVDAYFRFLQSGPLTWIDSTLTEKRPQLSMTYHLGLKTYDIKMLDPPGHDLRTFFSPQSKMDSSDPILDYVHNSNFIFLVINLRDFFQHPVQTDGKNKKYAVTDTVEMYLQALNKLQESANNQRKKRRVAVLWTAWKEYENKVNEAGGMKSFLQGLHLYDLHNLIHPSNPNTHFEIKEFFVDPVADTCANSEEATNEGHPRLPKANFNSYELEAPSEWLADMILNIETSKTSSEERANSAQKSTEYGRLMFERNPNEAFNSFKKAIELDCNFADAYDCLGVCYWNGHGVPKNEREAYSAFKQAAHLGAASIEDRFQKLDGKYSDITKTFELEELRKDIAEAKMLKSKMYAKMQHTKEQADARAEKAEQNADKRVKEAEENASEAIEQAKIQSSIVSAEKEKVEKQRNFLRVVLLIVSLLLVAVTIYKS